MNIPTAEDFLFDFFNNTNIPFQSEIAVAMKDFAILHKNAALIAASENIEYEYTTDNSERVIKESSIINSYLDSNIK